MKNEAVRNEMLKCHENCRVGVMFCGGKAFLVWHNANGMHKEAIAADECTIASNELKMACERATWSLIN